MERLTTEQQIRAHALRAAVEASKDQEAPMFTLLRAEKYVKFIEKGEVAR